MKAYKHLVKHALATGNTVSVFEGEIWEVKRSTGYKTIIDCIESVDEAQLRIRNSDSDVIGWARVSAYGLADDETVIDHSITPFLEQWSDAYESTVA